GQFMFAYMLASGEGKKEEKNTFADFGSIFESIFESDSNIDLKTAFLWARIASLNGYRDAENLAEFIKFQIDDNVILEIEALAEKCLESAYRNCSVT
nr:hypothetical protein [Gammaproteobacteria bacterium]